MSTPSYICFNIIRLKIMILLLLCFYVGIYCNIIKILQTKNEYLISKISIQYNKCIVEIKFKIIDTIEYEYMKLY